jgi:hypothetical protein
MKSVFLCSAFQGLEENLVLARKYCRYALVKDNHPFAPHLIYPQFLKESSKCEREYGIALGKEKLHKCDDMWVFVRNGILTTGMKDELDYACDYFYGCIFFFDATDPENIVELKHLALGTGMKKKTLPTQSELLAPKPFAKVASSGLESIAAALKAGTRYEELQDQLEAFLGPVDAVEQNSEVDAEWENNYRMGRD